MNNLPDKAVEALEPCPFCAGAPIMLADHKKLGYYVACTECHAGTKTGTKAEAVVFWNRRAALPHLPGWEVRKLEWKDTALMRPYNRLAIAIAETPFGQYEVEKAINGVLTVTTLNGQVVPPAHPDKPAAKSIAQADYEARIKAALVPADCWQPIETAPQDGTEILVGGWLDDEWRCDISAYTDTSHRRGFRHRNGAQWATHWQRLPAALPPPPKDMVDATTPMERNDG